MRGIFFKDNEASYREDLEIPVRKSSQSLIKITHAGICNTDKEILRGYRPQFSGIMGHEFVGIVCESDDERLVGKRVVGELNHGCGKCHYCKNGLSKHCKDRIVIGMEGHDGCFAEYMAWENDLLHPLPENLDSEAALLTEPLAAAVEIASQIHLKPEKNVLVIGDGRLSLQIANVLSLSGIDLTVLGKHDEKLDLFRNIAKTVKSTDGDFDIVVDATGSKSGLETAIERVKRQGTIVLKSTYAGTADVDMSKIVVNEISIVGSRCGPFEPALRLLERGIIHLPKPELYDLKDWKKAFGSNSFKSGFLLV